MIGDIGLLDRDRMELRAGAGGHFAGDFAFGIGGLVEGQSKRLDRRSGIQRGESERGAGVKASTQVTAHWNIRPHSEPHGFLEYRGELLDIVTVRFAIASQSL